MTFSVLAILVLCASSPMVSAAPGPHSSANRNHIVWLLEARQTSDHIHSCHIVLIGARMMRGRSADSLRRVTFLNLQFERFRRSCRVAGTAPRMFQLKLIGCLTRKGYMFIATKGHLKPKVCTLHLLETFGVSPCRFSFCFKLLFLLCVQVILERWDRLTLAP